MGNTNGLQGFWIFLIVCGFFVLIAVIALIIYKILNPKLKNDEEHKNTEQENAKENLDRILQPVEDEEIAKQIEDYKEDE